MLHQKLAARLHPPPPQFPPPLYDGSALVADASCDATHAAASKKRKLTPAERNDRLVREECHPLKRADVAGMSAVRMRAYLKAMGVTVARSDSHNADSLCVLLLAQLDVRGCDEWSYMYTHLDV